VFECMYINMSDVICQYCGEPWEYFHLKQELDSGERVLSGEGCPLCDWGENEEATHTSEWMSSLDRATDEDPLKYL